MTADKRGQAMFSESHLPISLAHHCGEHQRDLNLAYPIGPQVRDIFAEAQVRFTPGRIQAAFAIVNGMVVIFDGYTIGILCEYMENEGQLPEYLLGLGLAYNGNAVRGDQMDPDKIRRFYATQNGQILFRASRRSAN